MNTAERDLVLETRAAIAMRNVLLSMTDDDQAIADTLEGATNIHEAIEAVFHLLQEDEIMLAGLGETINKLSDRKERIGRRVGRLRDAIERGMSVAEIPKFELPEATLSLRRVPPKAEVANEAIIPPQFFIPQPPKLDKAALLDALKSGTDVPGAALSNGGQSLSIRRA